MSATAGRRRPVPAHPGRTAQRRLASQLRGARERARRLRPSADRLVKAWTGSQQLRQPARFGKGHRRPARAVSARPPAPRLQQPSRPWLTGLRTLARSTPRSHRFLASRATKGPTPIRRAQPARGRPRPSAVPLPCQRARRHVATTRRRAPRRGSTPPVLRCSCRRQGLTHGQCLLPATAPPPVGRPAGPAARPPRSTATRALTRPSISSTLRRRPARCCPSAASTPCNPTNHRQPRDA
mmetsp:Transcript_2341/g.9152  ORF Transcript_2341/g.9152 Transcript_2341/m.9152 type:complete len:239 (-) Transcript_2341:1168-1884(-)